MNLAAAISIFVGLGLSVAQSAHGQFILDYKPIPPVVKVGSSAEPITPSKRNADLSWFFSGGTLADQSVYEKFGFRMSPNIEFWRAYSKKHFEMLKRSKETPEKVSKRRKRKERE